MEFTFSNSASSKQLLVGVENLEFFQKIKDNNILLDLKFNGKVTEDVLRRKQINRVCPDITKLGDLKDELINQSNQSITKLKIKKIIIELE